MLPWLVHAYTGVGAVCAFLAAQAVVLDMCAGISLVVRRCADRQLRRMVCSTRQVQKHLPQFSGAKLDDIVDYLTYVFVPALIVWRAHLVPPAWSLAVAAAMLLSCAYGFVSADAKTDDHFFTGFPSYWNIVVLYLVMLELPPLANVIILVALAALVSFGLATSIQPDHGLAQRTLIMCALWGALMLLLILRLPNPPRALAGVSLLFPVYYVVLSVALHMQRSDAGPVLNGPR